MFDAVVFSTGMPEPAARTLAGLVEGVVQSFVGRVLIVSSTADPGLEKLADASGCRLEQRVAPRAVAGVLSAHLASPHVLAFAAGAMLPHGWPTLLSQEFRRSGHPQATATLAFRPEPLGARLLLTAAARTSGRISLAYGVLAPRAHLVDKTFEGINLRPRGPLRVARLTVSRLD